MGLLSGHDRDQWEPFVMLGLERGLNDRPPRERRRLLDRVRGNDAERQAFTVLAVLNFAAAEARGEVVAAAVEEGKEGGRLIAILDWLAEHKEFIEWLIGLFSGLSGGAMANLAQEAQGMTTDGGESVEELLRRLLSKIGVPCP